MLVAQYNLQVSNYSFHLFHFSIDKEIEQNFLVNHEIHNHDTNSNKQMSIFHVNRFQTKYCVLHNGMITRNSLLHVLKVNVSFSLFEDNG